MNNQRLAVIMAGGSGERFWPLSRAHRPKQLLRLSSPSETMLEEAAARISPLVGEGQTYISTSHQLKPYIEEAGVVPTDQVLAEPMRRNTLGALVWTVSSLLSRGFAPDQTSVAIVTADHKIADASAFRACVEDAFGLAEASGGLVTIGIQPTRAETGFGYIEADLKAPNLAGYRSRGFREKPDALTAQSFIEKGNFWWNSGMFFFTLGAFITALTETQPEAATIAVAIASALRQGDETAAIALFEALPNLSVDYAVMEKASRVFVIPSTFDWDDLGAWDALERSMPTDDSGSVAEGDILTIDSSGCILYNDNPSQVLTVIGMRDVIVVSTADAILVCPKDEAQRVKEIVAALSDRVQKI